MTALPHDYYLKFTDGEVLQDTIDFHAKTNYTIHESVAHLSYLHRFSDDMLRVMAGNELQLYPDLDITVPHEVIDFADRALPFVRDESCETFTEKSFSFATLKSLLSPATVASNISHKRGYPSPGALYPIEIFVCSLSSSNQGWPCQKKVLHVLSNSRTFEIVRHTEDVTRLRHALLPPGSNIGSPNIALIYISYLPKILFKYRFRGYRMANMESGALYMLFDLSAKNLNLKNRVWSGYCDTMVTQSLGLNCALFQPLCVQFFGHAK